MREERARVSEERARVEINRLREGRRGEARGEETEREERGE